ncbi:hypothetical protein NWFMUON74_11690 [Nocardia wallacei]|uniref:Uncharacterized protein n=2 Tax=Nocardia wallacei TaxID=480035 RepID=A0A7G1KDS9_9NOCA|nr:hypothetical protein NWFMUON74_11690 [Nocardia wallacei]
MRRLPTAMGWIDPDMSDSLEWDVAQVRRLARRLGYQLIWRGDSPVRLVDQVRAEEVDVVLVPAPYHLGVLEIDAVTHIADIETACPRLSFSRWAVGSGGR